MIHAFACRGDQATAHVTRGPQGNPHPAAAGTPVIHCTTWLPGQPKSTVDHAWEVAERTELLDHHWICDELPEHRGIVARVVR
jgi:hypothetical protein